MPAKKIGRPTDNPKPYRVSTRLDVKTKAILDAYCVQEGVNGMEAVRRAIAKLESDLEEKK